MAHPGSVIKTTISAFDCNTSFQLQLSQTQFSNTSCTQADTHTHTSQQNKISLNPEPSHQIHDNCVSDFVFPECRLDSSQKAAEKYLQQFPSPGLTQVANFVSFIAGSFAALLLFMTLMDDFLLERDLFGRHVVW